MQYDIRIRVEADEAKANALRDQFAALVDEGLVAQDVAQATALFQVIAFDKKNNKPVKQTIEATDKAAAAEQVASTNVAVVDVR